MVVNKIEFTSPEAMVGFSWEKIITSELLKNPFVACSAGGFRRDEWIYISIGCSGRHLELEKQWRQRI